MSDNTFQDDGMGPGVKSGATAAGDLMPEQMDRGGGAVYDRAIKAGATHEQAELEVTKHVFGSNFQRDKRGNPVQQGIGSPGHETANHYAAIRKYQGEIAFERAVREIYKRDPKRAVALGLPTPPAA